jgi:hypothetical protein
MGPPVGVAEVVAVTMVPVTVPVPDVLGALGIAPESGVYLV